MDLREHREISNNNYATSFRNVVKKYFMGHKLSCTKMLCFVNVLLIYVFSLISLQMDSKKSPLALLAQTCSQIGVDSGNNLKPIVLEKSKKDRPPSAPKSDLNGLVKNEKPELKLAFKPYEMNVLTKESSSEKRVPSRNSEKDSSDRSSTSPSNNNNNNNTISSNNNIKEENEKEDKGASPIIRSGLEVLQGKDNYRPFLPPGFETNPAFRSPYLSPHHAAMLAAAAYPQNPYMSYARIKTPSGAEALVPVCKDPYCASCQFAAHNQSMMMGQPCPQGCTQCEHQKYLAAGYRGAAAAGYACSWPIGGTYCGKRFDTSDELFAHMRSHSQSDPALLNPLLFSQSAALRSYAAQPSLSPLSAAAIAARYHPYSKPSMPTFNPAAFNPALQYYSPYAAALYSQRMGAAP